MTKTRVFVALVALALAACAENRPDIDMVQPNATLKKDLLGREWYVRTTVVQGNFTNAESFPGAMGGLERGVFDVQEKALYFYRTYEFIQGSEAHTLKSDVDVPMRDAAGKPLSKVYVKVYARAADGRVKFHKDGYTDIRGRFDYASVSTPEPVPVQRYGVLVLSETLGATIRDAAPPAGSERGSVPLETPAP